MNDRLNSMIPPKDREIAEYLIATDKDPAVAAEHFDVSESVVKDAAFIAGVKRCECCKFWHYEDEITAHGPDKMCFDCASNFEVVSDDY